MPSEIAESGQKRKCQETANTAQDTKRIKHEDKEDGLELSRQQTVSSDVSKEVVESQPENRISYAGFNITAPVRQRWLWLEDLMMDVSDLIPAWDAGTAGIDTIEVDVLLLGYCLMCRMIAKTLTIKASEYRSLVQESNNAPKRSRLPGYKETETLEDMEGFWGKGPMRVVGKSPKTYLRLWRSLARNIAGRWFQSGSTVQ
ncbi:hypothetical protein AnigIFM50267_007524 [Aspergillus niger]|nr:hypothetical protein AnigIFM50267_007524 [Aspergillus niger]